MILRTGILVAAALMLVGPTSAAPILCQNPDYNHMLIDSSQVSECLDAGLGNLSGNPDGGNPDAFLSSPSGSGFVLASKSDGSNPYDLQYTSAVTGAGEGGTWSFDSSFWDSFGVGALGFKFGTGNTADEWFVYQLVHGVSSGDWDFIRVLASGAGGDRLSHMMLYGKTGTTTVPEPTTLALLGLGLLLISVRRWCERR